MITDPLLILYRYYFGKIHCFIFGHKPDKDMFKYKKYFCDRCYLIKNIKQ